MENIEFNNVNKEMLENAILKFKSISKQFNIPLEAVIETFKAIEIKRRNDLYAMSGNDEQMSQFKDILFDIAANIQTVTDTITSNEHV